MYHPTRRTLLLGGLCLALPPVAVRASARPEFEFEAIAPGIWRHVSWLQLPSGGWFPSNAVVIAGRQRILMVDTAWTPDQTTLLLDRLAAVAPDLPIDLFVTHRHDDRMGGLAVTKARGIRSFAFAPTVAEARRESKGIIDSLLPSNAYRFDLGGREVEVYYPGPGHTVDNSVAYDRSSRTLFGGCLVRALRFKDLGNVADAVVARWGDSVERVEKRYPDARRVIPGHGDPGDIALLAHTRALARARDA